MKKKLEKIVFFGSGPVAAASLSFLKDNFDVELVITKPATEKEMKSIISCPVITVSKKSELDNLIKSLGYKSKIGVIVDFGIIVSQEVIDAFDLGIINSHFSLLPEWRGADPISFAILSGQKKTGVSLMIIEPTLDTGKLLTYRGLPLAPDETTPSLTRKLIELSNSLLLEYIPRYTSGEVKPKSQPHPERATYSRKLTKEDGIIDWSKPAEQIEREIRAFIDWPKSRTTLASKDVIITNAEVIEAQGPKGKIQLSDKSLLVFCGKNALRINKLQPAGKKQMTADSFINGHRHLLG